MPVALALFYLSRGIECVGASPVDIKRRVVQSCDDSNNSRTTWDIIWSCLVTIFSCTWVAFHTNIPAPYESSFEIGLRRLCVMIMAVIAPELVIMFAMRQWLVARRLARRHRAKGWTQVHGFFAIMGGFILIDGDNVANALDPNQLEVLEREGRIKFPEITKKEIEDKSKGDALSKGFVVIQTGWFVLQSLARAVERLPLTELELTTLAFAVLNLVTYCLWWNKPLDVKLPISVYFHQNSERKLEHGDGEFQGFLKRVTQSAVAFFRSGWEGMVYRLIRPFVHLGFSNQSVKPSTKRVPTFYSGYLEGAEVTIAALTGMTVTTIFGAIHCIAWSFAFASHEKEILWQICSLAITCIPVLMYLSFGMNYMTSFNSRLPSWLETSLLVAASLTYILARLILIVEAFILLSSLPPGAFQTVHWTTFIPHV